MGAILNLMGGRLLPYLLSAAVAAGAAWWITDTIDTAAIDRITAEQQAAALKGWQEDMKQIAAFQAKQEVAADAVKAKLKEADADREMQSAQLAALLNQEGMKDAKLQACLDLRLPDSVLRSLTR